MLVAQTARLLLREITTDDAENAFQLNLDPDVIKYTGDVSFSSIDEARNFLNNYTHYKEYGFGRWAVITKTDGVFVGWCGLKYIKEVDEYDIGFRLFKKYWNQGYATEAATECLKIGFHRFNMPAIVGRAMKENKASIRVLEKIGLHFYKNFDFDGQEGVVYRIEKEKVVKK